MDASDKSKQPAVFARNHREYIEEAVRIAHSEPDRPIAFRSANTWTTAGRSLDRSRVLPLYLAAVGGAGMVEYEADLVDIHLVDEQGDVASQAYLERCLPSTYDEGFWESDEAGVGTFYVQANCRRLAQPFPLTELLKQSDGKPISADFKYSYSNVWQHHPHDEIETALPGEIENPGSFVEGSTRKVFVVVYERSVAARAACLAHHGYDCAACGFNFERAYGDLGRHFIHVHHIVPLATVDTRYEIDPVEDLIPLCPNCHAMAHRSESAPSVEALREVLRANRPTSTKKSSICND